MIWLLRGVAIFGKDSKVDKTVESERSPWNGVADGISP